MPKGLYIHIPFCDHICTYCDFPKLFTKGQNHEGYIQALINELKIYYQDNQFKDIETIYIGGGTPTALEIDRIDPLFRWLSDHLALEKITEFSIEANPENLTKDKIMYYKGMGVNRFSLGVQTFNPKLLKIIGRKHSPQQVEQAVAQLKACDIHNINLDLIYSIPTQTLEDLEYDLAQVQQLNVEHVSAYSLIVEEHTKLYLDYMKDKLELIDNELEANMYETVMETLTQMGYSQYEISNFSKSRPSIHNQWYWKNEEYYGVGLGAHGYRFNHRYQNTRSLPQYIEKLSVNILPIVEKHELTVHEKLEEEMFLGLRLVSGIQIEYVNKKYNIDLFECYRDVFQTFIAKGYLREDAGWIKLTRTGFLMANEVFEGVLLTT